MKTKGRAALSLLITLGLSNSANAFYCTSQGKTIVPDATGTAIFVNLAPSVQIGGNVVVDLGKDILCMNLAPDQYLDPVRIVGGQFTGPLDTLRGSITYYGTPYSFPITAPTKTVNHTWGALVPWQTVLYLTVIGSGASGVAVNAGQMLATISMDKIELDGEESYIWNIYANNSVVVPTGGCDVSSRNVTVTLPDYPGTAAIPLSVHCAQSQNLAYFLTGPTTGGTDSIFGNTATASPATGIGVQVSNRNGVISTNRNISLGAVGVSPVELGMTASYTRTGGQVVAGNVQAIIGVTFVYQ
ncbi:fimbrial protein [Pseudomonas sp. Xaverov 259]|uniref:fimbrial protein n=1 Tax=Pseudomonas sp. Xaverov 259 TaxID=2666086 RepID=UPI001C5A885F|nr:fimbrial protein [Pseudomonas sp. Xaverov 259]